MAFIPLDQCEHGQLYHIRARNFRLGIFNEPKQEFIGVRSKLGSRYLFGEYHWDKGAPHGTVKPIAKLEQAPPWQLADWPEGTPDYDNIFAWLEAKADEYPRDAYPHEAPGHS